MTLVISKAKGYNKQASQNNPCLCCDTLTCSGLCH